MNGQPSPLARGRERHRAALVATGLHCALVRGESALRHQRAEGFR